MLLKLHTKLAPWWAFIRVNFDPIQEIGPKVGGGPFFARLRYITVSERKTKCETKTALGGTKYSGMDGLRGPLLRGTIYSMTIACLLE